MKNLLIIIGLIVGINACSTSDEDAMQPDTAAVISELKGIVENGQWRVTYFFDSDKDETDNFNGFTFSFSSNGSITATKGTVNVTGSWSIINDDDGDDHSDGEDVYDDIDFNISFSTPYDFEELTEDWEIITYTNTKIELKHVSGGNGGTDFLTLERI
ncbi:hypothetical protein QQ008_21105 [Fulvivirgaceae bacterium BMA10]|uniref:Lipocalin-like domain-containing protein n=1 Tax=Splendidivirga corallicola TaxID=3051826 RepID=A0ABT8KT43_9BACT|nr:hypothetical protein [Fulvivirgaceae bacterium BMA10]